MPSIRNEWAGKLALVTGASSGIGAASALEFVRHGLQVVLVARRGDRLNQLAEQISQFGGCAQVISADLTQAAEREAVFEQVSTNPAKVELLLNNAGFGWYGYYSDMPWEIAHEMLQVNISAVAHLSSLFLPGMRARDRGHIINVGSVAGSFPNQGVAVYSATKSFLDAFSTALHRELAGSHVTCSVVRAGPVATEFFSKAASRPAGRAIPAERFSVTPEQVAYRIWDLLLHPRRVIYVPRILSITPWIELVFGRLIDRLGPLLLRRSI